MTEKPELQLWSSVTLDSSYENEMYKSEVLPQYQAPSLLDQMSKADAAKGQKDFREEVALGLRQWKEGKTQSG